jgi:gamma-glutamylcyclotransferase (GGCT)/AIG2-like uncharacterized protein YtfP
MCADIMAKVSGYTKPGISATLKEFFRFSVQGEEYPAIALQKKASVTGMLYTNVSAEGLKRLDIFEGEMYERRTVAVHDQAAKVYQAEVYVFRPEFQHLLLDIEWDFDAFLTTGKRKFEEAYKGFHAIE